MAHELKFAVADADSAGMVQLSPESGRSSTEPRPSADDETRAIAVIAGSVAVLSFVYAALLALVDTGSDAVAIAYATLALLSGAVSIVTRSGGCRRSLAPVAVGAIVVSLAAVAAAETLVVGSGTSEVVVVLAMVAAGSGLSSPRWFAATTSAILLGSEAATVLAGGSGVALGIVALLAGALSCVALFVQRTRVARELASARAKVLANAVLDPLTGLANRRGVALLAAPILEAARRQGDALHAIVLSVEGLAPVREQRGDAAGSDILVAVAEALRASVRGTDVVGRWGAEHFCVVGPGAGMPGPELERRVREHVVPRVAVDAQIWQPRLTAGSAVLAPWDGGTLDAVLDEADREMHHRRALVGRAAQRRRARDEPRQPGRADVPERPDAPGPVA